MARKPESLTGRAAPGSGSAASLARRGLAAMKKAALRRPAPPLRLVRRLAPRRPGSA